MKTGIVCAAATFFAFTTANPAQALSCGSYSTNKILDSNLTVLATGSAPCITLTSGADLNLGGYTITCALDPNFPGVNICGPIIRATAVNSIVQNGSIVADNTVIDRAIEEATQVKDINFDGINGGSFYYAIENTTIGATKIQGNVIRDVATAIYVTMPASTSDIVDNFIENSSTEGAAAIFIAGSTTGDGPRVINNLITQHVTGIQADESLHARILDNVLCSTREGEPYFGSIIADPLHTVSGNVCCDSDPNDDCPMLSAPFVLP